MGKGRIKFRFHKRRPVLSANRTENVADSKPSGMHHFVSFLNVFLLLVTSVLWSVDGTRRLVNIKCSQNCPDCDSSLTVFAEYQRWQFDVARCLY